MRTVLAILVMLFALQFTGGLMKLERAWPGALCWSLAPSYGEREGMCSHGGGVMIWLWPSD